MPPVRSYASNHKIPIITAQKNVRKEDFVLPFYQRFKKEVGVVCILKNLWNRIAPFVPICLSGLVSLDFLSAYADLISKLFGMRITRRINGKLQSVLDKRDVACPVKGHLYLEVLQVPK